MSKKETWSYDFSWTQPYVNMQGFPGMSCGEVYKALEELETADEIAKLDATDRAVDLMDRYPDAEAMIERLKRDFL